MEDTIINVISNVGFPIAVSIALFYQMNKSNEAFLQLLKEFSEIINNNTKSVELLNHTMQRIERDCKDEIKKSKD